MSIQIITGFTVNNSTPLDNRIVASGAAARNSIPYKYTGLRVFDTSDNRSYYYNGTTFSAEITDQVNGVAGYVPLFTSQNYIGNSGVFQVSTGTEKRIGVGTNNPTGNNTYMQFGGMSLAEDPNYVAGQAPPLVIHKGGTTIIGSNWYYTGFVGGNGYFNSSKGSSLISFGNDQGDLSISNRPGGSGAPVQTIYLSNNNKVGIGSNWSSTVLPAEILDVTGNIKTSGFFKGDGSQITNIISDRSKTASTVTVYNSQVSPSSSGLKYMMFSSTASNVNGASVSTYYNNSRGTGFAFNSVTAQMLLPTYYLTGLMFGSAELNGPDNPPIAFGNDSGIFGAGVDTAIPGTSPIVYTAPFIGFSVSGSVPFRLYATYSLSTSPIRYSNGTPTAPSITFTGDIDTGIYRPTTNQIAFTTNGTPRMHIKGTNAGNGGVVFTTATSLGTGTTTKSPYIQVGAVSTSFSTAAAPDYTWYGYTQSGMYMPSANVIAFSTSGTKKLEIKQGGATDIIIHSPLNNATLTINKYDLSLGNGYTVISSNALCSIDWTGQQNFFISSNASVTGSLSKGSGSFRIDHPIESMKDKYELVHSFIEGPKADLIYRGKVSLVNGKSEINLDESSNMTEGTFVLLNRDVQCFTTNETGWTPVKGKVTGNILEIISESNTSSDEISWMVIGERHDKHMYDTEWTDDNGRVIVEPLKKPKDI
jgi:hypothetical protein